jgi:hypothetical protein
MPMVCGKIAEATNQAGSTEICIHAVLTMLNTFWKCMREIENRYLLQQDKITTSVCSQLYLSSAGYGVSKLACRRCA